MSGKQFRVSQRAPTTAKPDVDRWMQEVSDALNYMPSDASDVAVTSSYTPLVRNQFIYADASGSTISVYLPSGTTDHGAFFWVKKTDSSANAVVVVGTIDGAVNTSLKTQNWSYTMRSYGGNYYIV